MRPASCRGRDRQGTKMPDRFLTPEKLQRAKGMGQGSDSQTAAASWRKDSLSRCYSKTLVYLS